MKIKTTYLMLALFFGINLNAQETVPEPKIKTREIDVYREVDVMAKYRGGYELVLKKIEEATKNCKRGKFKGKSGDVVLDVLISDKGKVVKTDIIKAPTDLCSDDIRKALEQSNQWIPARVDGKPVYSYLTLTVNLLNGSR